METCRWCFEPLRDVSEPQMSGERIERWVHDWGGGQLCWPDKQGSPRAAPEPPPEPRVPLTHEEIEEMLAVYVAGARDGMEAALRKAYVPQLRHALSVSPLERFAASEPTAKGTVTFEVQQDPSD